MDKRHHWFNEGAESHYRVMVQFGNTDSLGASSHMYPCPICLSQFPVEAIDDGQLTIEHVPPESLGGRGLLLTCAQCNNTAGTAFDAEAKKTERLRSFFAGTHDRPVSAKFALNGADVNGDIHLVGAGQPSPSKDSEISIEVESDASIHFETVPRNNNPANVEKFDAARQEVAGNQFTVSFAPNLRTSPARSGISWIRTAYLAAFSVFGWRYILRPVFEPIRTQLLLGRQAQLPELYRYDAAADPERREILVVCETEYCLCVVVVIGQHIVFLPFIWPSVSLEDLATKARSAQENGATFSGFSELWPDRPRYELDRLAGQG